MSLEDKRASLDKRAVQNLPYGLSFAMKIPTPQTNKLEFAQVHLFIVETFKLLIKANAQLLLF